MRTYDQRWLKASVAQKLRITSWLDTLQKGLIVRGEHAGEHETVPMATAWVGQAAAGVLAVEPRPRRVRDASRTHETGGPCPFNPGGSTKPVRASSPSRASPPPSTI